jgi:hypothetical protein
MLMLLMLLMLLSKTRQTRQFQLVKSLCIYKPINRTRQSFQRNSLRGIVTQRTVKIDSDIQEQQSEEQQSVDKNDNTLSHPDQWLKQVAWNNFSTGMSRTDASNTLRVCSNAFFLFFFLNFQNVVRNRM